MRRPDRSGGFTLKHMAVLPVVETRDLFRGSRGHLRITTTGSLLSFSEFAARLTYPRTVWLLQDRCAVLPPSGVGRSPGYCAECATPRSMGPRRTAKLKAAQIGSMNTLYDQHCHRKYLTPSERDAFLKPADDSAVREVRTFCATLSYTDVGSRRRWRSRQTASTSRTAPYRCGKSVQMRLPALTKWPEIFHDPCRLHKERTQSRRCRRNSERIYPGNCGLNSSFHEAPDSSLQLRTDIRAIRQCGVNAAA